MIELDYSNADAVIRFIDSSHFFERSVYYYDEQYEKSRPLVIKMDPFKNGSKKVKSGRTLITLHFSKPLNKINTGIDFGPLGQEYAPKIDQSKRLWSDDGSSFSFYADLEPGKHYQLFISNNFRMKNNIRLKPYLIDFKTAKAK
jgi:hypothetical protein